MKKFSNVYNAAENIFSIKKYQSQLIIMKHYLKHCQASDCCPLMETGLHSWKVFLKIVSLIYKHTLVSKIYYENTVLCTLLFHSFFPEINEHQNHIVKAKDFFYNYIENLLEKEETLASKIMLLQRLMISSLTWMRMMVVRVESDVNLCQWFLWLQVQDYFIF